LATAFLPLPPADRNNPPTSPASTSSTVSIRVIVLSFGRRNRQLSFDRN
jgi:hypothetical protein